MTDVEMARQAVGRWKATAEALARDIWSYAELPYLSLIHISEPTRH